MFESLESRQMMSATSLKVVKVRAPRPVTPPIVMMAGDSPSQQAAREMTGDEVIGGWGRTPEQRKFPSPTKGPHL
jgi:hypothetical protein